jgi:Putative mono-oxygenase ydhR
MITAIATFKLPKAISLREAKAIFESTAPRYRTQKGLIRKYYVLSEDGATAGGIYLWQSREDAAALYTDDWKAFVRSKYGSDPSLVYMESPVIVDNLTEEILTS